MTMTAPFEDIARAAARKWTIDGLDFDDVLQEARIAAWQSASSWNPTGGLSRRNFAGFAIERRMHTIVKATYTDRRRANRGSRSFDEPLGSDSADTLADVTPCRQATVVELVAQRDELRAVTAGAGLSLVERRALVGHLIGATYSEMGEPKQIDNALQRAKRKHAEGLVEDAFRDQERAARRDRARALLATPPRRKRGRPKGGRALDHDLVVRLHATGLGLTAIARMVGAAPSSIAYICSRAAA